MSLYTVATCTDLGYSVDNGDVSYSRDSMEQGRYVKNTTVTLSCDEGYRGGGDTTCQNDGNWTSLSLPGCTSESIVTIACMSFPIHVRITARYICTGDSATESGLSEQHVLMIIFIPLALVGLL